MSRPSSAPKLKVFMAEHFDPWFNLATEDWIFRDMDPSYNILFLWRNHDTVVIGRFQNPWTECNLEQMENDQVKLSRRQSGGGAVFHDLGNTNFTFMSGNGSYNREANNQIITRALERFGIKAMPSGRNDILVDDKKISGSAFKEAKDRKFHHGTLLINADLSRLSNYLSPKKKKLLSKGITSVRSRVANLSDYCPGLTHEDVSMAVVEEFFKFYDSSCEIETLNHADLATIPKLYEYYQRLKDWNWRFGETPQFNHHLENRFSWGDMDVHIDAHKGNIEKVVIYSDSLHPEMIECLMKSLQGKRYDPAGIGEAIKMAQEELPMVRDYLDEFGRWLATEIR